MSAPSNYDVRRSAVITILMALVVMLASLFFGTGTAGATQDAPKVTICHRTASHTNPYVVITVDRASVDGDLGNDKGQGDHYLEHRGPVGPIDSGEWGDIIPPIEGVHGGLNWTKAGQSIYNNGCEPCPTPTTTSTTSTTVPKTTTTTTSTTTSTVPVTTSTSTTVPKTTTTSTTVPVTTSTTTTTVKVTLIPPATTIKVDSPPVTSPPAELAHTGTYTAPMAIGALGMVALGAYLLRKQRQRTSAN